jgi:PmbA protein
MKTKQVQAIEAILESTLDRLKKAGADQAGVSYSTDESRTLGLRFGKLEKMGASNSMSIDLEAWIGNRYGATSVISANPDDLNNAITTMIAAIHTKNGDDFALPASPDQLSKVRDNRRLEIYNPSTISQDSIIQIVRSMEEAALNMPKINNAGGASFGQSKNLNVSLTSFGGYFHSRATSYGLSVSVIAEEDGEMQSDHASSSSRYLSGLESPIALGILAGERAAANLNPQPGKSGHFPVVFHPDIAASLLGHFTGAASGGALRSGQTFLSLDDLEKDLFTTSITIKSNPLLKGGLASCAYTGDGLAATAETFVEKGALKGFFMGLENSRRFNQPVMSGGNLTIEPDMSYQDMMADIKDGLYVTSLMGQGVNMTNGNYSRSAKGFWIKDGKIDHAVKGVTIAGNLRDMFKNMVAADDLNRFKSQIATPHLRVDGMTLA